jgi:CheY-like chemotaxis protein
MIEKVNCILLVEDNEITNIFNKRMIEKSEKVNVIHVAENGQEALDYLLNNGKYIGTKHLFPLPDLILLDINMPIMDGWDFMEAFEQLQLTNKETITVVMLTTSPNPDDEKKAFSYPTVKYYMRKPLTPEELINILEDKITWIR